MQYIKSRMLDRELKKGSAELLILSLVEAQPRHGYDLSKLIEARSGGVLKFRVASLYPLLYRLEKRGWIHGRWIEKAGQRRRRYYRLTPTGAEVLASQRSTWREFVEAISRDCGSRTCLSGRRHLNQEMRQHLDDEYRALRASGVPHDDAMRRAGRRRRRVRSMRRAPGRAVTATCASRCGPSARTPASPRSSS